MMLPSFDGGLDAGCHSGNGRLFRSPVKSNGERWFDGR
jgi:hypothetical protein